MSQLKSFFTSRSFVRSGMAPRTGRAKAFRAGSLFRRTALWAGVLLGGQEQGVSPVERVPLTQDGLSVERSCRVEVAPGVLADSGAEGVLAVVGDGVTVELAGELRGSPANAAPDTFAGVGIRVTGKNVTLRGARVSGYKVAI